MTTLYHQLTTQTTRELLAADRLLLESRGGFARAAPYLILFINLFANGYLHPLIREDPTGYVLALFFFLKSSAISGLFLLHYFTVSESILTRTDHLPIPRNSRFLLVMIGGLRTPGVSGLLATDLAFLAVILSATPGAAAIALYAMTLLVVSSLGLVCLGAFLFRRSDRPFTSLAALGALGFFIVAMALIVFRTSGLLPLVPLVWLAQGAVLSALAGATPQTLGLSGGLVVVTAAILLLARRFG